MRPTEKVPRSCEGIGSAGQDLRQKLPEERRSWHLSVFFRITQLFLQLLFKLVLLTFQTNFQRKSNPFPTSFKTISNQITIPLRILKKFQPKVCKYFPIKSQKVRSKGQNPFPKCQSFLKVKVFSLFCQFFILG